MLKVLIFLLCYTYALITFKKNYAVCMKVLKRKCSMGLAEVIVSGLITAGAYLVYTNSFGYRLHGPLIFLIFWFFVFSVVWLYDHNCLIPEKKRRYGYSAVAIVMLVLNDLMYILPAGNQRPEEFIGHLFLLGIGGITIFNITSFPKFRRIYEENLRRNNWILYGIITFLSFATLETLSGNFVFMVLPQHWLMNMIWFFILSGLFYVLFHKMKRALLFSLLLMSTLGIANGFIVLFRGSPILPADLHLVETAMAVSGNYSFRMPFYMYIGIAVLLETIVIITQIQEIPQTKKEKRNFAVLYAAVVILALPCFYVNASLLRNAINLWRPVQTYRHYGSLNGFGINLYAMKVEKPTGYSVEAVNEILQNYTSDVVTGEEKLPNIITIMCETFSDLSVIGDFQTNQEVMPYLNSLNENIIKGYAYSSVLGGMTANSEFEFLTGNATAFLPAGSVPYQQFVQGEMYSFTNTLRSLGYSTTALHAYERNTYRREGVYPLLGFEEYLAQESFTNPEYLREYISDQSDFEKVIQLYETRDKEKPFFLFNVTMQNHSGYDQKTMDYNIQLEGNMANRYEDAEEYLSCINHTDQALKTLIEYFAQQEEPTYIIFFGDHQPNLDSGFTDKVMGGDLEELSLSEMQKRYQVPFFIWSNQEIEEKTVNAISLNYLSSFFLKETGLPMTAYNKYLMDLYEKYPVININGVMDSSGKQYKASVMKEKQELLDYNKLVYHSLIDKYEGAEWAYKLIGVPDIIKIEEVANTVEE